MRARTHTYDLSNDRMTARDSLGLMTNPTASKRAAPTVRHVAYARIHHQGRYYKALLCNEACQDRYYE